MKIIFLDFDGVLNSRANLFDGLDSRKVDLLNFIIEKTNAKVVVSSWWRVGMKVSDLQFLLESHGFKGRVISKTPIIRDAERGIEIQAWLDRYRRPVDSFIILDDDDDMGDLRGHLVQTDTKIGLQPFEVEVAVNCLVRSDSNV